MNERKKLLLTNYQYKKLALIINEKDEDLASEIIEDLPFDADFIGNMSYCSNLIKYDIENMIDINQTYLKFSEFGKKWQSSVMLICCLTKNQATNSEAETMIHLFLKYLKNELMYNRLLIGLSNMEEKETIAIVQISKVYGQLLKEKSSTNIDDKVNKMVECLNCNGYVVDAEWLKKEVESSKDDSDSEIFQKISRVYYNILCNI